MTTNREQSFLHRPGVDIFARSSVPCVAVSNELRCDAQLQPSEASNQAGSPASIIRRKHYDAMLPSLSLPNRTRVRLTLDLMAGIPFLFMLWGVDELRASPARIASVFHRAAIGNRREKRRKKYESSVKNRLVKSSQPMLAVPGCRDNANEPKAVPVVRAENRTARAVAEPKIAFCPARQFMTK